MFWMIEKLLDSYLMFINDIYFLCFVVCVLYVQGVGNKEWREVRMKSFLKITVREDMV